MYSPAETNGFGGGEDGSSEFVWDARATMPLKSKAVIARRGLTALHARLTFPLRSMRFEYIWKHTHSS
jgi:hypothetical protein